MENSFRLIGFWPRFVASIIDALLVSLITWPSLSLIYGTSYWSLKRPLIYGYADLAYNHFLPMVLVVSLWVWCQSTPGKDVFRCKIVDAESGGKPKLWQWIVRYLGYYIAILPLGIGLLIVAFDKRKQGWHDKMARTLVVARTDSRTTYLNMSDFIGFQKKRSKVNNKSYSRFKIPKSCIVGCCGLLLAFSGLFFWIGRFVYEFNGFVSCDEFRRYDFLKVELPTSAMILNERCSESFNPYYEVIFMMSADDLTIFQEYVSQIESWQPDPSKSFSTESVWQEVEDDMRKQGASLETALYGWYENGLVSMSVVVDTSNTQQYFVHYFASYVD